MKTALSSGVVFTNWPGSGLCLGWAVIQFGFAVFQLPLSSHRQFLVPEECFISPPAGTLGQKKRSAPLQWFLAGLSLKASMGSNAPKWLKSWLRRAQSAYLQMLQVIFSILKRQIVCSHPMSVVAFQLPSRGKWNLPFQYFSCSYV